MQRGGVCVQRDIALSRTQSVTYAYRLIPSAASNPNADRAVFKAEKESSRRVKEASGGSSASLKSYMSLPASQYSVLDARKIERIDDCSFRCYVGELKIFQW